MAVSFELPPATTASSSPVRYQDTLPPITPSERDTKEKGITTEKDITEERDLTNEKMPIVPMREIDQPEIASDVAQSETIREKLTSAAEETTIKKSTEAVEPFEQEDIALQFAHDDVAIPVAGQIQKEQVSTLPEALAVDSAADKLLAASSEHPPALVGSSGMVRSLQQRLNQSNSDSSTSAANILQADILEDWIYEGGSNSLVARTVGSAEGTRKSNGERTKAYYGHVDPGNGVWNLGTFSYQHEASSPEEADEKQLMRLQRQEHQLKEKAALWKVPLSIEVRLNGLDLANQAPLAALDEGGYIERLAEAYASGKSGEAAIVWARTQAYFDPNKQAWDAPGLGNNRYSIQRDQERRIAAINSALQRYQDEHVGTIGNLLKVGVASTSAAAEHHLLAKPNLTNTSSLNGIDFSLDAASPAISQHTSESVVDNSVVDKSEAIAAEPQIQPVDLVEASIPEGNISQSNVSQSNIPEANALLADSQIIDASTADRSAVAAVDNSEATVEDSGLAIESDLADLSQVRLGEWNEGYETAARETTNLIEAESVPLDDGLAFAADQIADLPTADDYAIAPQSTDADIAETETKLAPIASVLEQQETTFLPEEAQREDRDEAQEKDLIEAKLDRLLRGIEPGDRSHPF